MATTSSSSSARDSRPSPTNINLSFVTSVADPGCLSRFRIFPSRIQGQKRDLSATTFSSSSASDSRTFTNKYKNYHLCPMLRIRDVYIGSRIPFFHPGPGSKRYEVATTSSSSSASDSRTFANKYITIICVQCCGSRMIIPNPNFSIPDPGSKRYGTRWPPPPHPPLPAILEPRNKNKTIICFQSCGSGMFIPDPNFSIPDPGSNKKIPGGNHLLILLCQRF